MKLGQNVDIPQKPLVSPPQHQIRHPKFLCTIYLIKMKKSKNLSSIEAIIAHKNGSYMEGDQHRGCSLWSWASNQNAAWQLIIMIIRSNFNFCNFCPQNSLDSPPWVARNLQVQSRRGHNSQTKRPIAKISPLFTLQLSILSTGACFKVVLRKFKGTFKSFFFDLWHP